MRDVMDDLFEGLEEGSPLAAEVDALLASGLAVDDAEVDAATAAVWRHLHPRRIWPVVVVSALAAAALVAVAIGARAPATPSPVAPTPTPLAHTPEAAPAPGSLTPAVAAEPERVAATEARVDACLETLAAKDYQRSLQAFNALLGSGDLSPDQLRTLALTLHGHAVKSADDPAVATLLLEQTSTAYAAWLEAFPGDPGAADMHYAFAELLYKTGRFDEALDHYRAVVVDHPGSKHAAFCAESAVFAAEQILALRQADDPTVGAAGLAPVERDLLAVLDLAVEHASPDKEQVLAYKGAYLQYSNEDYADAVARFAEVIALDPRTPEATKAAQLTIDAWVSQEDWSAVEQAALAFEEQPELGDAAFDTEMRDLARKAGYQHLTLEGGTGDAWLQHLERYGAWSDDAVQATVDALRAEGRDDDADAVEADR